MDWSTMVGSVAAAAVALALIFFGMKACTDYNQQWFATKRLCIQQGGTYIMNICVAPGAKK